jgi:hypothetical protein
MWTHIFFELGRYLSTVKEEQKKDFITHYELCLHLVTQYHPDMADSARKITRKCLEEIDKLQRYVSPEDLKKPN